MLNMPASGSLRSTANDMLKFITAYLKPGRTPLAAAMALQLRERLPLGPGWQALGWSITREGIVSHSGGKQGYRSAAAFDPQTGRGVVVLANARTDDQPIGIALHLLAGRPLAPAPAAPATTSSRSMPRRSTATPVATALPMVKSWNSRATSLIC